MNYYRRDTGVESRVKKPRWTIPRQTDIAPDISELVLHERLETVFLPEHPNQTRHIRTYQGSRTW